MNETISSIVHDIIFNNFLQIGILCFIVIFLIVGYFISPKSGKAVIESLLNRFFLIVILTYIIYNVVINYFLFNYTCFYDIFKISDVFSILIFDFFIYSFTSYKLSYDSKFFPKIFKELLYSLILKYSLNFIRLLITVFNRKSFNMDFLSYFINDLFLIIIMSILIFPLFYLISILMEYCEIYSTYGLDCTIFILKSCKLNVKHIFDAKKKLNMMDGNINEENSPMFIFKDNIIFSNSKEIGIYQINVSIPKDSNKMHHCLTKYKKIKYIVNYGEGKDNIYNFLYINLDNKNIKLCLNTKKCVPLNIESNLIEFVFENKNDIKF